MITLFYTPAPVTVVFDDLQEEFSKLCFYYAQKVTAIKAIRSSTGLGLKESKDLVDSHWALLKQNGTAQHWSTPYLDKQDCIERNQPVKSLGDLLKNKLDNK